MPTRSNSHINTFVAALLGACATLLCTAAEAAVDVAGYEETNSWPLESAVHAFDVSPAGGFALLTHKGVPQGEARLEIHRFDLADGSNKTIKLERGADGLMIRPTSEAAAIAIAEDGATFLANWPAYLVSVDAESGVMQAVTTIRDAGKGMTAFNVLEYAPDGSAAIGVGDEVVRFDLSGEGLAYHRDIESAGGQSLAVIGPMKAAIGNTENITVVSAGAGEPECVIGGGASDLDLSPDGSSLAGAVYDQEAKRRDIVIWSLVDCREVARWSAGVSFVPDIAWLPDGEQIAASGGDGKLRFWNVATGEQVHTMTVEPDAGFKMHFSNDATRLITYTLWGDRMLRVFQFR